MIRYLIIHNKHEGCYDFQCYQDEVARIRLTSITINPPKIFMFTDREEAQDFFEEYINDIDCIDIKCRKNEDVEHVDFCTCGIIELDDKGEPILFYNKRNQIFLMENTPQMFLPNQELKNDIRNLNLTNRLIRRCKSLGREQRKRYIDLGKYCEDCNAEETSDDEAEKSTELDNIIIQDRVPKKKKDESIVPPTPPGIPMCYQVTIPVPVTAHTQFPISKPAANPNPIIPTPIIPGPGPSDEKPIMHTQMPVPITITTTPIAAIAAANAAMAAAAASSSSSFSSSSSEPPKKRAYNKKPVEEGAEKKKRGPNKKSAESSAL